MERRADEDDEESPGARLEDYEEAGEEEERMRAVG